MKIKFVSNYDNDFNIYKSILNCYPMSEEDKQIITYEQNYDYLFIYNGYNKPINTDRSRVIGLLQEPIGNINYDRNLHFYCSKILCQNKNMFKGAIEHPLFMFFSNHVNYEYKNFYNLSEKEKKLCIFVSGIQAPNNPNWKNNNYSIRMNLLDLILKSNLDIDIYGRGLSIEDSRYKGSPENKHDILKKYKFSVSIENCCEKNYVSEKFFDCILNETLPIYFGCPNIDEIYNKNCYLSLDIIDPIKQLQNISENMYNDKLSYVKEAKNKYFNDFNIISFLKKEVLK